MSDIKQSKTIMIRRSQINMAGYNPRKITPEARRKLEKNLKTMGLMGGIVWNRTTGNLVSGHQRLTILDKEQGYTEGSLDHDYDVYVVEVELTMKQEKEQNIFFNNQSAMGFFDEDKLKDLMKDVDFSEMTGFSKQNQISLFAETELSDEDYAEIAQQVEQSTKGLVDMVKDSRSEQGANYIVLVFKNRGELNSILSGIQEDVHFDDGRFCNGEDFLEYIYSKAQEAE